MLLAAVPVSAEHRTLGDRREYFADDVVVLVVQPADRAVRPNATVETTVVAHNLLSEEAAVNGTLVLHPPGATGSPGDTLLEIDRTLPADGSANWTVSVEVARPGDHGFEFLSRATLPEGPEEEQEDFRQDRVRTFSEPIVGLAPVAVDLLDRDRGDPLVAVPGETTTFRFRVATVGDATVSNLTLAFDQGGVDVNESIAQLGPDASTTVELPVTWPEDPELGSGDEAERPIGRDVGVRVGGELSNLRPQIRGNSSIGPFDQGLWDTEADPPRPYGIGVHLVRSSGLKVLHARGQMGEQMTIQLAAAAPAGDRLDVDGELRFSLPGIPSTRATRTISLGAAPGEVRIESLTWTPSGQGPYRMVFQGPRELLRDVQFIQIDPEGPTGSTGGGGAATLEVDGPVTFHHDEDDEMGRSTPSIGIPGTEGPRLGPLEIGDSTSYAVDITAGEGLRIRAVGLTTTSAIGPSAFRSLRDDLPYEGPVSMTDLVAVDRVETVHLGEGERRNVTLDLTARASGQYDLLPVLETSEGLVVASRPVSLVVEMDGSAVGMSLVPPIAVGALLFGHVTWRRRWVE